jgi:hypothetical protein
MFIPLDSYGASAMVALAPWHTGRFSVLKYIARFLLVSSLYTIYHLFHYVLRSICTHNFLFDIRVQEPSNMALYACILGLLPGQRGA